MIPTDANLQHQIAVDSIHHILPSNMAIPSEFAVGGHPNALTWTLRPNLQTYPPPSLEVIYKFHLIFTFDIFYLCCSRFL